jgi:hypothetical protein
MNKNSSFTQTQLIIVIVLSAVIFTILGGGAAYLMNFLKTSPEVVLSPTNTNPLSVNALVLPTELPLTATLVPTYVYLPTFTAIPTGTSFTVNTMVPQQVQNSSAPAANNPVYNSSSSACAADLEYAATMHSYYLDMVDYVHSPMLEYYQYALDVAVRNRDALGVVQAENGLKNERAQVNSEKSSENQRYKAEKASINSRCN